MNKDSDDFLAIRANQLESLSARLDNLEQHEVGGAQCQNRLRRNR